MVKKRQVTATVLVGGVLVGAASAATYTAPMETTRWQVDASVFACKLYQPVERYGEAVFLQRAGEQPRFYLAEHNRQLGEGEVVIASHSPLWEGAYRTSPVDRVVASDSAEPVQMDWRASQTLISQLHAGRQLSFVSSSWHRADEQVQVMLAPIRFGAAFSEYLACTEGLLPANYDQISRSTVEFPAGATEFDDDQLQVLDNLVRYVLADRHVTALVIDGHSDGHGLRADNLELSKQRAEAVYAYITERGVPEELVELRWHGERYPIASNRTPEGRAENRRVTLRVDRFEPEQMAARQE